MKTTTSIHLSMLLILSLNCSAKENQLLSDAEMFKKLRSNEPNYFVAAFDEDSNDEHLEFNLSIKYPLLDNSTSWWQSRAGDNSDLLFIYNGTYDFYFGGRDSSPVISRRQNPGIAFHRYNGGRTQNSYRIGWYHESNGQTIDEVSELATEEYPEDHISRGWDYLGINAYFTPEDWRIELDLRLYCNCQALGQEDKEDEIFWDLSNDAQISDYDGLRLSIEPLKTSRNPNFGNIRLDIKMGNSEIKSLEHFSTKVTLFNLFNGPWTAFYFNGYGREVASYHERNEYIAFGFEFR